MTFEPRKIFRADYARGWSDFMSSKQAEHAFMAALAAFIAESPPAQNDMEAAASHYRVEGARRFITVLRNLAESDIAERPKAPTVLNHKA